MTPYEQRRRDETQGKDWFNSLSYDEKWELGDALVLGDFDWRDYAERWGWSRKPSGAFLRGADNARIHWEIMLGDPSPMREGA